MSAASWGRTSRSPLPSERETFNASTTTGLTNTRRRTCRRRIWNWRLRSHVYANYTRYRFTDDRSLCVCVVAGVSSCAPLAVAPKNPRKTVFATSCRTLSTGEQIPRKNDRTADRWIRNDSYKRRASVKVIGDRLGNCAWSGRAYRCFRTYSNVSGTFLKRYRQNDSPSFPLVYYYSATEPDDRPSVGHLQRNSPVYKTARINGYLLFCPFVSVSRRNYVKPYAPTPNKRYGSDDCVVKTYSNTRGQIERRRIRRRCYRLP